MAHPSRTALFGLGGFPDREAAAEAVREEPGESADVVVDVERYAFGGGRIEVPAGSVVEWVNRDAVVHTATALDNAWKSGAIPPPESHGRPGSTCRGSTPTTAVHTRSCGGS